ncbi:MAG: PepSY-associated TM helix domain-containing protein [Pseudomonadota bacterium]
MRNLHRLLGLWLSGIVLIVSITGSLLLLKPEYLRVVVPEANQALQREQISIVLDALDPMYSNGEWRFIRLYSHNLSLHKVFLSERRYAWHTQSGRQLEVWSGNQRFEDWLLDLHHRLLLGNTIGLNIVGIAGLLLLPLVTFGFCLWWPRRKAFKYGFIPKYGRYGDTQRSHANLGAAIGIPVLLIVITGVILVYPSESRWLLQNGFSEQPPPVVTREGKVDSAAKWAWADQLNYVKSEFPDSIIRWAQPASEQSPFRVIGFQEKNALDKTGKSSVRFYKDGGTLIKVAQDQPMKVRAMNITYGLHTGDIHPVYRYAMVLFGFGLSALAILGFLTYWRRKSSSPA